jgi:pimeloyl-ACP methyl ester carboxylesterase
MNSYLFRAGLRTLLSLLFVGILPAQILAEVWTVLGSDRPDNGRDPSLADAAQLAYRYDKEQDLLWFRVALFNKPNEEAFGVNLVFDTGGDEASKMEWWGANKTFKFDRLVTAWVTRKDNRYQGTIGVGDAAGARAKRFNNLSQDNLQLRVEGDAIIIGVKRTDITDKMKMNVIAAVGSNEKWNDDVPGVGLGTIDLAAERPKRGCREIDLTRNNLDLPSQYKTLPDDQPPIIMRKGKGQRPLILIPGMNSGATSFDGFVARNEKNFSFYIVMPPGINGTASRPMPAAGTSFGELTWTRRLERDILDLIHREKLVKPVIVAEQHPASVAATELADEHPDEIGGVVLAASFPGLFVASPKDATRKIPATLSERTHAIDVGAGGKWFKFVTPETWLSNNTPAQALSKVLARGQKAADELEAAPLEVKIRYLCEFWASDMTGNLDKSRLPILALVPQFDEKFLAEPANSGFKTAYIDRWETLKAPMVEITKIPDARLLVLDDQPQKADDAITKFVDRVSKPDSGKAKRGQS